MGKRINQNFIGIPHQKMIEMIEYKANLAGIVVIQANEAYTSQTSFLDNEIPINQNGDKARKRKGLSPVQSHRPAYQPDLKLKPYRHPWLLLNILLNMLNLIIK